MGGPNGFAFNFGCISRHVEGLEQRRRLWATSWNLVAEHAVEFATFCLQGIDIVLQIRYNLLFPLHLYDLFWLTDDMEVLRQHLFSSLPFF